jgi:hypothetical protein
MWEACGSDIGKTPARDNAEAGNALIFNYLEKEWLGNLDSNQD